MASVHLTDLVVSRLKTIGIYYDSTTPAFGIRVGKSRKAWIITQGVERQRITIGRYPALSLAEARKLARKRLAEEPQKGGRLTLNEAYERYKEVIATKKARTQRDYKRIIDKYLVPSLGKKKLAEVAYEDITKITNLLPQCEAGHCLSLGRTFFRWCVRPPRRYIAHSPLEGVTVTLGKKRKRVLLPEELKAVWFAAERQGYPHGTIVKLLILTGQRKGEIAHLRRGWIDEKEKTITLPEPITKNSKEHVFPFGDIAASILEVIPRLNSTDLLFPSRASDERPVSGWSKYKQTLQDGVPSWRLHDLRRTFRTIHAQIGTPSHIAERIINHAAAVQTDVEAIYDVYRYLPEMRAAMQAYEVFIAALIKQPC